jgi:tetratricopeptide (TPR) repeat protein
MTSSSRSLAPSRAGAHRSILAAILCGAIAWSCGAARSPGARGADSAGAHRWDEALRAFDRAAEREPERLEWRRERVRAAHRSGHLADRLRRLRGAVRPESSLPADMYELALAVSSDGEPRSDEEALRLLALVAARLPDEPDVHYRIGLIRLEREDYEDAVAPLERAAELDPRSATTRVALADALGRSGQEDRAREVVRDLAELDPTNQDLERAAAVLARLNSPQLHVPHALRGAYRDAVSALSEESESPGEAIQLIDEALAVAPDCAPLITLNGLASVRLGQLGRARTAFERAAELWPGDPTPWMELAALDAEAEDRAAAEEHLETALQADPLSTDAWAELGRVRYQRQRFEDAARAFRRLVRLDGGSMLSMLWLGRALRRAGQDEAAEDVYRSLLADHPATFEAHVQLGHIYRARRLEERDRERARELLESARQAYRQALEVRPHDPMVQRALDALEDLP